MSFGDGKVNVPAGAEDRDRWERCLKEEDMRRWESCSKVVARSSEVEADLGRPVGWGTSACAI